MKTATTTVFAQILRLLPRDAFNELVQKIDPSPTYEGRCKKSLNARKYTRWDQFVSLLFCHLAQCDSLREIEDGLYSAVGKLEHVGAIPMKRTTMSYQNAHYSYELFEKLYFKLLKKFEALIGRRLSLKFKKPVYSLDSTTITVSMSLFDWAHYRHHKGAVKLHTVLNNQTLLPCVVDLTDGKCGDVSMAKQCISQLPNDCFVVMDRGYNDYELFWWLNSRQTQFVTRLREDAVTSPPKKAILSERAGKWGDYVITFTSKTGVENSGQNEFRLIQWYDEDNDRWFEFVTNNFELKPQEIAKLYRSRWKIELFFKKLKQNLVIKSFIGTSANAVMSQVWTAAICVLLVEMLRIRSSFEWGFSRLMKYLSMNILLHRDLTDLINRPDLPPHRYKRQQYAPPEPEQLNLF